MNTPSQAGSSPECRVSVVICTRERPVSFARTLDSVLATNPAPMEIIVVDNARVTDATQEVVQARSGGAIPLRYVTEPRPGLSRARNRGVAETAGDVIAFTDDDVRVAENWIGAIAQGFARDTRVGCVTGRIEPMSLETPAQQYFNWRVAWPDSHAQRFYRRKQFPGDSPLHPYASGTFGAGANFAMTRQTLHQVGDFDQLLGAGSDAKGGEDLDIFVRVLLADFLISYEPDVIVWHEHRADSEGLRKQMFDYGAGLTAYFMKYLLRGQSRRFLLRHAVGAAVIASHMIPKEAAGPEQIPGAREFARAERRGLVAGPFLYLKSRFMTRTRARRLASFAPVLGRASDTARQTAAQSSPAGKETAGLVATTVCTATTLTSYGFIALSRLSVAIGIESARRSCDQLAHAVVLAYLRRVHRQTIDAYRTAPHLPASASGSPRVWLMWWQGEPQAPEIVQVCLASLRRYLPAVEVTVITEENFREYVDIDEIFLRRVADGDMPLMQLSCLIRVALLHRHGGIWIDATYLALQEIPAEVFDLPFYTGRVQPGSPVHDRYVQDGKWFANLIGGAPGNPVFQFVYDMFLEHWSRHKRGVHYDHFDYCVALAYEQNIAGFRDAVDALDYSSQKTLDLRWILKEPFDPAVFEQFVHSDTALYKLDRRFEVCASDADGTIYGFLRDRFLVPESSGRGRGLDPEPERADRVPGHR